eukprot:m.85738 g.85738  ORF g.85738 m.85738 type:complete len:194 (+) comp14850_c1_seq1:93-674(+)
MATEGGSATGSGHGSGHACGSSPSSGRHRRRSATAQEAASLEVVRVTGARRSATIATASIAATSIADLVLFKPLSVARHHLHAIVALSLAGTGLSTLDLSALGGPLANLAVLDLHANKLSSLLSESVDSSVVPLHSLLPRLRALYLHENAIETEDAIATPLSQFAARGTLHLLTVHGNPVSLSPSCRPTLVAA